jgi:hypothetical protein
MVALVSGFLFDERTHLVDLYFPAAGTTIQYWTGGTSWSPSALTAPSGSALWRRPFGSALLVAPSDSVAR